MIRKGDSVLVLGFTLFLVATTSAFSLPSLIAQPTTTTTRLFAENGPPKYNKYDGLLTAEEVGKGCVALHIDSVSSSALPADYYKPGHVLALEMEDLSGETKDNDGWMRGPYTVSRVKMNTKDDPAADNTVCSFDVVVKVVGKKTEAFAAAKPKTPVRFGGKFHVPILDGVSTTTDDDDGAKKRTGTHRVVMISTGVGVGPCVGAIEMALLSESHSEFPPIELYASYQTKEEIAYEEYLDELSNKYSDRFMWKPIITGGTEGRISSSEKSLKMMFANNGGVDATTHYHLIGNAQMVQEFQKGLLQSGIVPKEKITIERYFNHKEPINEEVVERISNAVKKYSKKSLDASNNAPIESSSILI